MQRGISVVLVFAILCGAGLMAAWWLRYTNAGPTTDEYLARLGPAASLVAAGKLTFDGEPFACGRRPTVLAPGFSDYAAAFYGFLIVNPERFAALPLILKRYAYTHECGHQFVGADEDMADCYAIRTGVKQGWLDDAGMDAICAFISKSKGDLRHPPGVRRCQAMRVCYAKARPGGRAPAS